MIAIFAFLVVLGLAGFLISKRISQLVRMVKLGKPQPLTGSSAARWKRVLLIALGQKKMFSRPIPAILHLFIYVGFLVINLEVLEFMADGITGQHRTFAALAGSLYPWLLNLFEFLAAAVLIACVFFLTRRYVVKVPRFQSPELKAWPRLDATLILVTEIILMLAILTMNAADQLLQPLDSHYPATGTLWISSLLKPLLSGLSLESLHLIERTAWWFHITGILGFAIYVTYSKHLHIAFAFLNTYWSREQITGQLANMPVVTREVKIMLGLGEASTESAEPPGRFGAKDVVDLNRVALIGALSCTECGRCTSECPANLTGKKLSPRKIMMDVRDRMEELTHPKLSEEGRQKTLLDHYITREEINACTSCNACVEACPVLINPLDIIIELRRYVAMEESGTPASWNAVFQNIETNFAPWKFPASDRFNWAKPAQP